MKRLLYARLLKLNACRARSSSPSRFGVCIAPPPWQPRFISDKPFRQQMKEQKKAEKSLKKFNNEAFLQFEKSDTSSKSSDWELTVGIEIHAELDTERKLFSAALTNPTEEPNVNISLHDLAYPGAQPIFQAATVLPAIRAALVLGCDIQRRSSFDRKHYFYQDQPAGYQITQFYHPFAKQGTVSLRKEDGIASSDGEEIVVRVQQVQLEQDTAKSLTTDKNTVLLDFNRVSHPLIEIISHPDIHTPEAAAAYVRKVQSLLKAVGAVTAGMEMSGMRADVNVSVRRRPSGSEAVPLGQRTEIKNLGSLQSIVKAVRAEQARQIQLLEAGEKIKGETLGWDSLRNKIVFLRAKEGEVDYRYMPDPDIPPLIIGSDLLTLLSTTLTSTPEALAEMLQARYGLTKKDARTLSTLEDGSRVEYFFDVVDKARSLLAASDKDLARIGKQVSSYVLHAIGALVTKAEADALDIPKLVPIDQLAVLVQLYMTDRIHSQSAKTLLAKIFGNEDGARGISVMKLAERDGMLQAEKSSTDDPTELISPIAQEVFATNSDIVDAIVNRNEVKKMDYFMGLVMKELGKQGKSKLIKPNVVKQVVHDEFQKTYRS